MRLAAVGLVTVLFTTGLTSCVSSSGRCVDYVALDSPQERFDAADVVVLAEVRTTGRTIDSFAEYPLYRARTIQVVKGTAPASFDLIAPSDQCERAAEPVEYLADDPLARFHRGVLYLVKGQEVWQLFTPGSLDPLPTGAPLPFDVEQHSSTTTR